jgi:hypothetical protein
VIVKRVILIDMVTVAKKNVTKRPYLLPRLSRICGRKQNGSTITTSVSNKSGQTVEYSLLRRSVIRLKTKLISLRISESQELHCSQDGILDQSY